MFGRGKCAVKSLVKIAKIAKGWFFNRELSRELIVMISRCRADRYNLDASVALVRMINNQKYSCGYKSRLYHVDHIIQQCPLFHTQKTKLIPQRLKLKYLQLPPSLTVLFVKSNVPACNCFLSFLKDCNIKI